MFQFIRKLFAPSPGSKPSRRLAAQKRPPAFRYDAAQLPAGLGLLPGVPLQQAVLRLESAIPSDYAERLKHRVLSEHPRMSDDEFACKWFELKRFFLMNLILKSTPMFSSSIDAIWHEMLMFTREYQRFGERFARRIIHHAPEREPKQMPEERAWFDWIYAHLFEMAPSSRMCWGGFFRYPLDRERMDLLLAGNETEIASRWFDLEQAKHDPEAEMTIRMLVQQAIREAQHAAESDRFEETEWAHERAAGNGILYMAGAMMFFSMLGEDSYADSMLGVLPEGELERQQRDLSSCSSSGCSSFDGSWDGGSSDDSSGGGSDGGSGDSGGGSSCSSSSSSCSSSGCSS
ncbi:glycine-rich domain-containing protein [Paenibacillus aestuarii]|uniref:Uncharacterized protein n=1 Tax=Paenibacillus aestuarii TaxID=516965 RepID=A0ABW0KEE4_9BACL|nr:hypothetical protein [Paenibacillus aestuarii]